MCIIYIIYNIYIYNLVKDNIAKENTKRVNLTYAEVGSYNFK